jgi:hypothetical protein
MSERAEEIFNELVQVCTQYKAEVPSKRRAWPESVKVRVFELRSLGVKWGEIGRRTGLCPQTMMTWKPAGAFLPIKVVERAEATTMTVRVPRKYQKRQVPTVTVVTPSGYRLEGLDQSSALLLMEKFGR